MEKALRKYEEYSILCGDMIPKDQDAIIRKSMAEFKDSYSNYLLLLKEIEEHLEEYNNLYRSLQRIVFPCARKMQSEIRRKKLSDK